MKFFSSKLSWQQLMLRWMVRQMMLPLYCMVLVLVWSPLATDSAPEMFSIFLYSAIKYLFSCRYLAFCQAQSRHQYLLYWTAVDNAFFSGTNYVGRKHWSSIFLLQVKPNVIRLILNCKKLNQFGIVLTLFRAGEGTETPKLDFFIKLL